MGHGIEIEQREQDADAVPATTRTAQVNGMKQRLPKTTRRKLRAVYNRPNELGEQGTLFGGRHDYLAFRQRYINYGLR